MENRILNNRYKLEAEIGRGGMGVVYRAIDTQLHRTVAIKILPPEFVHNTQFLARFNSEIRNTSQLEHQNIVSVYDVGVDDNTNYYVMQYVDGQDLKAYLAQHGRLSVAETCRILGQIANALDYAHARGIVHRDIKPENILIDRQGVPNLTDFGIARSLEGTRMTTGMVGTPEYMSPEQAKGEDVCGRSDQYSLAIVAYEMLTGTTPFRSSTGQPWAIINKHINEPPADPRTITPSIASNCAAAVMTGLTKTAGERYSTCSRLVTAMHSTDVQVNSNQVLNEQVPWEIGLPPVVKPSAISGSHSDEMRQIPQTSGKAITSLVLGLIGLGPIGLIYGVMALNEIKYGKGKFTGQGLAIAGTITSTFSFILLLVAIVLPVTSRAREKARQTTCTSNQRQISASMQMYAQDHDVTLPSLSSVWSDVKVDPGVLTCPTLGKSTPNGYGYNQWMSNKSIGLIPDPTAAMLTADSNNSSNILTGVDDIDYRHSGLGIASYLDGHVTSVSRGSLQSLGQ